jgi:hypothetical protein
LLDGILGIHTHLSMQKLPPADVGVSNRRRRFLQSFEDPADGRGAHTLADLQKFALNPLVTPARILAGHPFNQFG